MKKYLLGLIAVVFAVASVAFTTKQKPVTDDRYEFVTLVSQKYYVDRDLTQLGWVENTDYACSVSSSICTLTADPANIKSDGGGSYFDAADVTSTQSSATFQTIP